MQYSQTKARMPRVGPKGSAEPLAQPGAASASCGTSGQSAPSEQKSWERSVAGSLPQKKSDNEQRILNLGGREPSKGIRRRGGGE